jgi:prephenate dehydrogenase
MPTTSKYTWNKIAIVGVGLIGGSIGLALRKRRLAKEIVGIGRRAASLATAKRVGSITASSTNLAKGVADADLVVICTPVDCIVEQVQLVASAAPGALITDVGSTKANIVAGLDRTIRFIGSHPITGNEKRGPQHAAADLFVNRTVIITPSDDSRPGDVRQLKKLWSSLGAKVVSMSADEHDRVVAGISHLPHLLASAIAAATPDRYVTLSAGGWQDTTRIAAGDPALWRQILLANRDHLLTALDQFDERLAAFRSAVERQDAVALEQLLTAAKKIRDAVTP